MKNRTRIFKAFAFISIILVTTAVGAQEGFWTEASGSARNPKYMEGSLSNLAEAAMPAVVTVYTKRDVKGFRFFFPQEYTLEGGGSGFIVSEDGYILTNNHVVQGSKEVSVVVGVKDKKEYNAKVIGTDKEIDVALIKIDATGLPVLPLGNSDKIRVGDWVSAIGSPFNFPHTFTVGVVSAKGRRLGMGNYDDFIQTDASINQGNSGGPLINMNGEVIGINTLIVSPSMGNVGIGFSTPINLAKMILPQLKESGKVTRSWLGVTISQVTGEVAEEKGLASANGALVQEVVVKSPADKAGLKVGDVITSFNGKAIKDSGELPSVVSSFGVGREAEIVWIRDGERMSRTIELEELPTRDELAQLNVRAQSDIDNELGIAVKSLTAEERDAMELDDDVQGVLVAEVASGSVAEQQDIKPGDIITRLNGVEIKGVSDFEQALGKLSPGKYARVSLQRGRMNLFRVFKLP